jgi:prepilin-type N-terminal cleavage/methylation domain-containing protein
MRQRRGFTLVEVLVVVGIIGLLLGILLPVMARARTASKRVSCRAQLADIGRLFQMYLNDSKNRLPWINSIPSIQPPFNDGKPITEVLRTYSKDVTAGWRCPADKILRKDHGAPDGYETYFDREGISYFYEPDLARFYGGRQLNDHPRFRNKQQNRLWIFKDFDSFHASRIVSGSCNYLFADMHVGDLADE